MKQEKRSEQILRDIRKVNMKVDTFIAEVNHHINKTNQEIKEREKRRLNL